MQDLTVPWPLKAPLSILHVDGREHISQGSTSRHNQQEAKAAAELVRKLVGHNEASRASTINTSEQESLPKRAAGSCSSSSSSSIPAAAGAGRIKGSSIGIITPYRAMVVPLKEELQGIDGVEVNTVDAFQVCCHVYQVLLTSNEFGIAL